MKRLLAGFVVVLGVLVAVLWGLAEGDGPKSEGVAPARVTDEPQRAAGVGVEVDDDVVDEPEKWIAAVDGVRADCGLALDSVCEGGTCVSTVAVPPLDGVGGWLAMTRTSPSLVAAVVAGELGLPDSAVACRTAIRGIGEGVILARADDGGETWCLTDGSVEGRALCDRATGGRLAFADGEDRVVELRPPAG